MNAGRPAAGDVVGSLRGWARGADGLEAAVEVLALAFGGRFAGPGNPWVAEGDAPGSWWLDVDRMTPGHLACLSGGEARLLLVVASLAGGAPVRLDDAVSGLDGPNLGLVLAAVAHAGGLLGPRPHLWPDTTTTTTPAGGRS